MAEIKVVADATELNRAAATAFQQGAGAAVHSKDSFVVALSGGSTPKGLFSQLPSNPEALPWRQMYFFWGDERRVPPDHPESNYRMAYETLLSRVPVPPENVLRIAAEHPDATRVAEQYEQTLKQFFHLQPGQLPRFDLMLLGLGPDGHTASLFPGSPALHERSRLVAANWVEKLKAYRITLTVPVINHAAYVLFLVSGKEKKQAFEAVLDPGSSADQFPAKLVCPMNGELIWLVDREVMPNQMRVSSRKN
jgi:6-phosphogluconolactonase